MAEEQSQPQESEQQPEQQPEAQPEQPGMAQQIIEEGGEDLTYTEQAEQYDSAFGEQYQAAASIIRRLTEARRSLKGNSDAATRDELSDLYDALALDVMTLQQETIQLIGVVVYNLYQQLDAAESDDEDYEEEGAEDSSGPDDEDVKIYATLQNNIRIFKMMRDSGTVAEDAKQGLQHQIDMNQESAAVFEEQFGDEIKKRFQQAMQTLQQSEPQADGGQEKESPQGS